jgi:hypothetical protein
VCVLVCLQTCSHLECSISAGQLSIKGPNAPQSRLLHRSAGSSALVESDKRSVIPCLQSATRPGGHARVGRCPARLGPCGDLQGTWCSTGIWIRRRVGGEWDAGRRRQQRCTQKMEAVKWRICGSPVEAWSVPDQRPHGLSEAIGASAMFACQKRSESPPKSAQPRALGTWRRKSQRCGLAVLSGRARLARALGAAVEKRC